MSDLDVVKKLLWKFAQEHKRATEGTVFEYVDELRTDQAVFANRDMFEDGRWRVFLNPAWQIDVEIYWDSLAGKFD